MKDDIRLLKAILLAGAVVLLPMILIIAVAYFNHFPK